ncbi:2OG-Fe(II) oxygenase [Neobacillus kokaensis]|uniref:2OG-Fe(II) oxygenase n=1 Tax=Neobacillus kokaensis TaxID=2759023 RepID=A0ABQ3MYM3_9BACI|nr:2OG-Fe(II) oxygenase [Neobacillus kokaensis]GHH96720.1 2OG-Fe(II) oxygenase [Neobacillus kokaensis]
MEKIAHISSELKDWILNTLKSGVHPEQIANAMIKKGFDPIFSYKTLLKLMNNNPIETVIREPRPYLYEIPEICKKGTIISTSDRDIKVLMKIEKPFIVYLDNVLSDEECDRLIEISISRLKPSKVVDSVTGEIKTASGRTSSGTYYQLNETALIGRIEQRLAELTDFPIENGEGMQVLNYKVGEEYKPHFDYFPENKIQLSTGGQRIGTVLMYLNNVQAGGETIFPKAGISVTPKKGSAVFFHYGNSEGQVDRMSLHSSIPVVEGEKWVATKWLRQSEIVERF